PQYREIGQGIAPDDIRFELPAVREGRMHAARALDDMCRGEQEAVGRDHDTAAAAAARAEARHGRAEPFRDAHHRLRVGVERFFVRQGDKLELGHGSTLARAMRSVPDSGPWPTSRPAVTGPS